MTGRSSRSQVVRAVAYTAAWAAIALQASAQGAAATPPVAWQARLAERPLSVSVAANAACVAVRTASHIQVLDHEGNRSWEAPYLLASPLPGIHAISPQCDWLAVFRPADDPGSFLLQILQKDGASTTVPLAAAIDVNSPHVNTLDISSDGRLLAVGFATGYLWIVARDGEVRTRVGPLTGAGVRARFTADGRQVVLTGWFNDGLMNPDGTWVWQYDTRELQASRNADLFAALTVPMHGPQYGDVAILDAGGKALWKGPAYDASMAMAPDGSFIALAGKSEKAEQPKEPPYPVAPELNATPEIWIHGRDGKVLAHETLQARVIGVSTDSSCVLVAPDYSDGRTPSNARRQWIAGFSRNLRESWRVNVAAVEPGLVAGDLLLDVEGDVISAYRIPRCG